MMLQCGGSTTTTPVRPPGTRGIRERRYRLRRGRALEGKGIKGKLSGSALSQCRHRRIASKAQDDPTSITESSEATETGDPLLAETNTNTNNSTDGPSNSPEKMTWGQLIPRRVRDFWQEGTSMMYLKDCSRVLRHNLWTLMSLTALNSAARFILVWTLYRTVCAVAVKFFGISTESIPHEMIPTSANSGDPNVYQQLADITFLLFKPFDFIIRGIFIAGGLLVCWESEQNPQKQVLRKNRFSLIRNMFRGFLRSFASTWSSLKKSPGYMPVYIIMGSLTAFYQALCLLIVPVLYAMRKLLNIELALCVSLVQGKKWKEALAQSAAIVEPVRKHLFFPYLFLLITPKALGFAREFVVRAFPDRLFVDVPEIAWLLITSTTVLAFLIDRMAEIFPIVIFSSADKGKKQTH